MNDIKKENERSKAFSEEKQNPPINTPQSASHKPEPSLQPHDLKESDEEYTGKEAEQIASPANPSWFEARNKLFVSSWCPLYGEIPEYFRRDELIEQCIRIIEESRKIWQCFPQSGVSKYPEWKLKLAQEMWNLFYTNFTTIFESQTYKDGTVDLECMRIVNWTRKISTLELKEITDYEIVALFAVYVTWRALEDWFTVEKGESLVGILYPPGDEYVFMKEKIRIAYLVLSEAMRIYTQTQEKTNNKIIHIPKQGTPLRTPQCSAKQGIIPFPTPSGTQWHEVKISFIDNENIKISARDKTENRHYSQMGFKDNKNNKPIFLWKFLKELASLSGRFTNCQHKEKDNVKKCFSNLRKVLFRLFGIKGNPVPYKKTENYTGYETAFVIEDKAFAREYEESVREHHKRYVPPKKTHHSCREENEDDNNEETIMF